ncbi:hypothetical protein HA47_12190 [Pantoea stewartii subsp. indologenes]|nr:hypothetical protein HA47_12190 [Pantoea stewartii subsp. indologenes]
MKTGGMPAVGDYSSSEEAAARGQTVLIMRFSAQDACVMQESGLLACGLSGQQGRCIVRPFYRQ